MNFKAITNYDYYDKQNKYLNYDNPVKTNIFYVAKSID